MRYTQTIVGRKEFKNEAWASIMRVYENGREVYGIAKAKRGDTSWTITMGGWSRNQIAKQLAHHVEDEHGVIVWCG